MSEEQASDQIVWWRREPPPLRLFLVVTAAVTVIAAAYIYVLPDEARTVPNVALIVQTTLIAVGLLSLVFIARQVRITREQSEDAARQGRLDHAWRKTLSYHQFFGDLVTAEVREKLTKVAKECGFDYARQKDQAMSDDAVEKIKDSPEYDALIACYLDEFEEFCGAVHAGLLDREYAYTLEATRIVRAWRVFEPYIAATRMETKDFRTYIEIERLGEEWRTRREGEDAAERKAVLDRTASNGVKSQV